MPRVISIQVGLPQTYTSAEGSTIEPATWTSAIWKHPLAGPVEVDAEGLAGDGQANRAVHGGVDKAVLAYSADHYPCWRAELGLDTMPPGAFGENLTLEGLVENDVCLGDRWQFAGGVVLEVSQPRTPCWKLGRRWQNKLLPKLVVQSGRSGWYFRVVQLGTLEAGFEMQLADRPYPAWTITRANRAMFHGASATELMELASLRQVSRTWLANLPA